MHADLCVCRDNKVSRCGHDKARPDTFELRQNTVGITGLQAQQHHAARSISSAEDPCTEVPVERHHDTIFAHSQNLCIFFAGRILSHPRDIMALTATENDHNVVHILVSENFHAPASARKMVSSEARAPAA